MSTQRANGRELTDDELSFERLASEIEELWHSVPPSKPSRPIESARPATPRLSLVTPPKRASAPKRIPQRVRPTPPAKAVAASDPIAIEPARREPPRSEPVRSEIGRSVLASVRSLARRAPSPPLLPVEAAPPVERQPAVHAALSQEPGRKDDPKPVLLPLCRPDVRIAVGDTVAVLNWSSHDGRTILMPIGLDGLEQLAHAVADALAVTLQKDLLRGR